MGTWMNNDGLYIKYGTDEATAGKAGAYGDVESGQHVVEANITLTGLGTSAAIVDDNVFIPAGVFITRVEIVATTAATSGGSAVLNLGLQRRDRSTELDYDGFVAAAPVADFGAAGNTVAYTQGSDEHGALIGTTLANSGYLTADYDTAAFTAGVLKVRIFFQKV